MLRPERVFELVGKNSLRVSDIDESVRVRGILEQISVESSLFHSLGVQSIGLLPVFLSREVLADQVGDGRILTLLGDELVKQDTSEEDSNGGDGSFLFATHNSLLARLNAPQWTGCG